MKKEERNSNGEILKVTSRTKKLVWVHDLAGKRHKSYVWTVSSKPVNRK